MASGRVRFFSPTGRFGFIVSDGEGVDFFFREKDVLRGSCSGSPSISAGQPVEFRPEETPRGPIAKNVNRFQSLETRKKHSLWVPDSPLIISALQDCTDELTSYLREHPEALYEIHPGTFENVVAAILGNEGFEVERISSWNEPDGGLDLLAIKYVSPKERVRFAVQCKRWARDRRVSAEPIRSLAGVLDRFRAHAGVIATTSFFSEPAKCEAQAHLWRIGLRDFDSILEGLSRLELLD